MNCIITFACGENYCKSLDFQVFISSCRQIQNTKVVIISDALNQTLPDNFLVIPPVAPIKSILRDRHLCFYHHLFNSSYEKCLVCDSRDLILQADPFESTSHLTLTSEGMKHSQSSWNMGDQFRFQSNLKDFQLDKMNQYVLNGGVIYGNPYYVANFCLLIWSNCLKSDSTDQAVINYLSSFVAPHVSSPLEDDFCVTGEGVKEGFVPLVERDTLFYNQKTNGLYKIFHQWDRTIYADAIRSKYGATHANS